MISLNTILVNDIIIYINTFECLHKSSCYFANCVVLVHFVKEKNLSDDIIYFLFKPHSRSYILDLAT